MCVCVHASVPTYAYNGREWPDPKLEGFSQGSKKANSCVS